MRKLKVLVKNTKDKALLWIISAIMKNNKMINYKDYYKKLNDGVFSKHPARIVLERYLRILPLYFFMILFLWKIISLLGGDGPRFY